MLTLADYLARAAEADRIADSFPGAMHRDWLREIAQDYRELAQSLAANDPTDDP